MKAFSKTPKPLSSHTDVQSIAESKSSGSQNKDSDLWKQVELEVKKLTPQKKENLARGILQIMSVQLTTDSTDDLS